VTRARRARASTRVRIVQRLAHADAWPGACESYARARAWRHAPSRILRCADLLRALRAATKCARISGKSISVRVA